VLLCEEMVVTFSTVKSLSHFHKEWFLATLAIYDLDIYQIYENHINAHKQIGIREPSRLNQITVDLFLALPMIVIVLANYERTIEWIRH
jgi:hypothetical protein